MNYVLNIAKIMTYMFYDVLRFILKAYEISVSAFVSQQLVRQVLKTGKIVPSLSKDGNVQLHVF